MNPGEVIAAAAARFGIPTEQLFQRGREKRRGVHRARCAAAWVLRERRSPPASFAQIGRHLKRHHSSVLLASRKAERLRREDLDFRLGTDELLQRVCADADLLK